MRILLVLLVACGASGPATRSNKPGAIAGLVRDAKSGEDVAMAEIMIAGKSTKSDEHGMYFLDGLAPGRYTVRGTFAGQPLTVNNVLVTAGDASYVDLTFTLGDPSPITYDWGDPREGEIKRFTALIPRIEGTVGDASTRQRIAGAVVTAVGAGETLQTVTDDHGRYRFERVTAGTYAVSAYYSISGRAQIEVRRADVVVEGGHAMFVPLWIELAKQ